uniref:ATPase AAA-type core domain-containing protein n=1 Tax=viral metagenome TaxID=1070528 RepID=A0A6C0ETU4_9ZZZZ
MTRDSKKEINRSSAYRRGLTGHPRGCRKLDEQSDSSDSEDSSFSEDDGDEMDAVEYQNFLAKMFPSKYINEKVKKGKDIKKFLKNLPQEDDSDEEEEILSKKNKKSKATKKNKKISKSSKHSKKYESSDEEDDEEEEEEEEEEEKPVKRRRNFKKSKKEKNVSDSEDSEEEEDSDEDEDDVGKSHRITKNGAGKFNIIFTIGNSSNENDDEDDDEDEWEDYDDDDDDDDDETEDEDEDIESSDEDSDDEDDDNEEEDDEEDEEEEEEYYSKSRKSKRFANKKETKKNRKDKKSDENDTTYSNTEIVDIIKKSTTDTEDPDIDSDEKMLQQLELIHSKNKNNKIIQDCIKVCEKGIKDKKKKSEKKEQKIKEKHGRIFKRIIRDKNTMNDFTFFEKIAPVEQKKIIKELREINKITRIEKPYRLTLLESNMPTIFKAAAMKKIASLRYMEPGSGEYYKIKNWTDTFMRIPFGKYDNLPVNISDGVDICHEFMENAQKTLDEAVYGLNDAKMQIMQMLGQLVTNPAAIGTAIAIKGPPGTGKTTLVKEGISKILNRPFAFIALGGATDSSFLEGHGYTYEGSIWGKIVQILIDSKCMNPVIYFDELDKISDTPKGEEIAGILTHLTDTTQNNQFHDKYFAEIDFDLSKCLFIFSYNDESKINPILKDRMYRIQTKGYDKKQKTVISKQYMLPKIREQVRFEIEDITIPDDSIHYIIENHCNKEDGVRNLKRCMEIIYTKLNLYRLMRPGSNLFEEDMSLKVEFPFVVTKDIVDKLIKKEDDNSMSLYGLYV